MSMHYGDVIMHGLGVGAVVLRNPNHMRRKPLAVAMDDERQFERHINRAFHIPLSL